MRDSLLVRGRDGKGGPNNQFWDHNPLYVMLDRVKADLKKVLIGYPDRIV